MVALSSRHQPRRVLVSCEPVVTPADETKFEITSERVVNVAAEGGTFVIAYTLSNGDHTAIKAETDNTDIITAINTEQQGFIIVSVAANTERFDREASIRVSYDGEAYIITVKQEKASVGEDYDKVSITANYLVGNYYGDNLASGVGHYWIILSEDGFEDGAVVANTEFFRLDILAPVPSNMDNIKIPDGDYEFDYDTTLKPYTIIDIGNTDYTWVDDNMEGWAKPLESATLRVSGNRLELVAVADMTEYTVIFEGEYSLGHSTITDHVSSLVKDTVIDVSNCSASISSYGDYWECGYNNWCLEFICNAGFTSGTYVVIDFLSESTTDFTGTYVASGFSEDDPTKPNFRGGVFVPGFRVADDADLLLGSLYMVYKDGLCVSQAPLYEGSVTITYNGDGTHTVIIDALDDAPQQNKITLNWTGRLN